MKEDDSFRLLTPEQAGIALLGILWLLWAIEPGLR